MIERCVVSGLTVPECSCPTCLRAMVDRHAPHLHDRRATGERAMTPERAPLRLVGLR